MSKTLQQTLVELQKIAGEYQKQLQLATIASYHGDQPEQVILNHLNDALEMLSQSTPKILVAQDFIKKQMAGVDVEK